MLDDNITACVNANYENKVKILRYMREIVVKVHIQFFAFSFFNSQNFTIFLFIRYHVSRRLLVATALRLQLPTVATMNPPHTTLLASSMRSSKEKQIA